MVALAEEFKNLAAALGRRAERHYLAGILVRLNESLMYAYCGKEVALVLIRLELWHRRTILAKSLVDFRKSGRTAFRQMQFLEEIAYATVAVEAVDNPLLA